MALVVGGLVGGAVAFVVGGSAALVVEGTVDCEAANPRKITDSRIDQKYLNNENTFPSSPINFLFKGDLPINF